MDILTQAAALVVFLYAVIIVLAVLGVIILAVFPLVEGGLFKLYGEVKKLLRQ